MTNTAEYIHSADATETAQLQHSLMRIIQTLVIRADYASAIFDLPVAHVKCLRVIAEKEDQMLREVAATLGVSLAGVSRTVDRLVKAGMVERKADERDRRALKLATTAKSRALLEDLRLAREARITACMEQLDPNAIPKIIAALDLLADAAERAHKPTGISTF